MEQLPWSLVRVLGTILILGPPVAYYVYQDRKRREQNHPVLWAIGLGLLGIAGLLLHLYWRGDFTPASD